MYMYSLYSLMFRLSGYAIIMTVAVPLGTVLVVLGLTFSDECKVNDCNIHLGSNTRGFGVKIFPVSTGLIMAFP